MILLQNSHPLGYGLSLILPTVTHPNVGHFRRREAPAELLIPPGSRLNLAFALGVSEEVAERALTEDPLRTLLANGLISRVPEAACPPPLPVGVAEIPPEAPADSPVLGPAVLGLADPIAPAPLVPAAPATVNPAVYLGEVCEVEPMIPLEPPVVAAVAATPDVVVVSTSPAPAPTPTPALTPAPAPALPALPELPDLDAPLNVTAESTPPPPPPLPPLPPPAAAAPAATASALSPAPTPAPEPEPVPMPTILPGPAWPAGEPSIGWKDEDLRAYAASLGVDAFAPRLRTKASVLRAIRDRQRQG